MTHLHQSQTKIQWPDVIFMAEAERQPFCDVHIRTAKSLFQEMIGGGIHATIKEQVKITEDGDIHVVINVDHIDDEVSFKALDMVAEAMYYLEGEAGVVHFSEPLQFKITDFATISSEVC
jgi:hypothetical protein